MKMKKMFAVLMMAVIACGLLVGCGGGQKPAEKKEATKPIVLGLDDNFPPMGFVDENNKIVGFDIDLATEAAKRSTYAYWANELCHMLTIKGGSEVVKYILADWRKRYKNRPAMMQELNRVKI